MEKTSPALPDIHWVTYAWVLGLSLWGGLARLLQSIVQRKVRKADLWEFASTAFTSTLAGITTLYFCMWGGYDPMLTHGLSGLAGYMGGKAMEKYTAYFNPPVPKV